MQNFNEDGYQTFKKFFNPTELEGVRGIVSDFHQSWIKDNQVFYQEKAVNSAYLTNSRYLTPRQRTELFQFIATNKLMSLVGSILPKGMFMNTQLFFDPVNKQQKNYWHRDPQYHLSLDQQKAALSGPEVIHCRIPLVDEPGIEFIPASHKNWDTEEELKVRLEQDGCRNSDDLLMAEKVKLAAGDLLVFSANMIHRGLYGNDRLALDILFCEVDPKLAEFISDECLPSAEILSELENAACFEACLRLKEGL